MMPDPIPEDPERLLDRQQIEDADALLPGRRLIAPDASQLVRGAKRPHDILHRD